MIVVWLIAARQADNVLGVVLALLIRNDDRVSHDVVDEFGTHRARIAQIVDPLYTVVVKLEKKYLGN